MSGVISYPVPAYSNPPIEPQFFQPSVFDIASISRGAQTTVTTTVDHNYVIGQQIRFLIPKYFGSYQLNNVSGYVIDIPSTTSVVVDVDSNFVDAFIPSPYISTITNITQSNPVTITTNNSFLIGNPIQVYDVGGMTEINFRVAPILSSNATSITLNLDSSTFSAYSSGGTCALYGVQPNPAQIIAIGDINSGILSATGSNISNIYFPGSFVNTSP